MYGARLSVFHGQFNSRFNGHFRRLVYVQPGHGLVLFYQRIVEISYGLVGSRYLLRVARHHYLRDALQYTRVIYAGRST